MNKKILILLILVIILLIPFTLSYDLSDFPKFIEKSYFDTLVIIGDNLNISDIIAGIDIIISYDDCAYLNFTNSTDISKPDVEISLPGIYPPALSRCRSAATTPASSITNLSAQNIISVGGPCANKVTAQIMDLPITWPECAEGFEDGKGIMKLYKKWDKTQLVVAGYSAQDTLKAGKILANYINYNLSGKEIGVTGNISNPIIRRVITEQEKKYCEKDDDCILVVSGCLPCNPCKTFKITDLEIISVNKNLYKCPPKPKNIACAGCVGIIEYDPYSDAICINNTCEKKGIIVSPNESNLVWMAKTPHQCGDYSVPNELYFNTPNTTIFPEMNGSISFPIKFSMKQNTFDFFKERFKYYGRNETESNEEASKFLEGEMILWEDVGFKFYDEEILIYDAKKVQILGEDGVPIGVCAACSCSAGYTTFLLISENDIDKLSEIGYTRSYEPKT